MLLTAVKEFGSPTAYHAPSVPITTSLLTRLWDEWISLHLLFRWLFIMCTRGKHTSPFVNFCGKKRVCVIS